METIIVAKDLGIGYQNSLFDHINLQIEKAKLIAVLGENGKGKSTLLKTLAADIAKTSGSIFLKGKEMAEWNQRQISAIIASVWTENPNIGLLLVEEFIAFGRYPFTNWMASLKKEDVLLVERAIDLCKISHLRKKDIQELSDGEKQKVMIARAISQDTEIIILDEPTTHLDLKNTVELFYLLKQLTVDYGKTIVFSTHKVELALQLADQIILFGDKVVEQGSAERLIANGAIQKEFQSDFLLFDVLKKRFELR